MLFIWLLILQSRVGELERKINEQFSAPKRAPEPVAPGVAVQNVPHVVSPAAYQAPEPVYQPVEPGFDVVAWFKEDWLLKLGIGLVIIGLGWFLAYAFANDLIGEQGRIALGLVSGALVLAFGWWRMMARPAQGGAFMTLGAIGIIMTAFADQEFYDLFSPEAALGLMFASLVFVTLASVQFRRLPLALVSLVLAGLAPFLSHAGNVEATFLFIYLLVVITGMLWAVVYTGWRELVLASLILTGFYSIGHWFSAGGQNYMILGIAWLLSIMFFVSHTLGITRKENESPADLWTAFMNGALVFGWTLDQVPTVLQSLTLAGWALVFAVGAFIVNKLTSKRAPFFIYGGISLVLIGAATAVELKGAVLTIAFIVEALVFILGVFAVTRDLAAAKKAVWILAIPGVLSLLSVVDGAWRVSAVNEHFFVLLLMAGALGLLGFFFHSYRQSPEDEITYQSLYVIGSIYGYVLLWLTLHAPGVLSANIATMVSLVVYTLAGLASYAYGRLENAKGLITYGGFLLGFVVLRLLVVDMRGMALEAKVITFFLIGALLISTAFIGRGKQPTIKV